MSLRIALLDVAVSTLDTAMVLLEIPVYVFDSSQAPTGSAVLLPRPLGHFPEGKCVHCLERNLQSQDIFKSIMCHVSIGFCKVALCLRGWLFTLY